MAWALARRGVTKSPSQLALETLESWQARCMCLGWWFCSKLWLCFFTAAAVHPACAAEGLQRTRPSCRSRTLAHSATHAHLRCEQEKEARNQLQSAVDEDGSLLDNLTLELRVHPPSIEIDNHMHEQWTTVTIDSANRPGSLIYVRV